MTSSEHMEYVGVHTLQLNGHDHEILRSLLRQLEFLQDEEEKANSTVAKDALHNQYVPIIMSMTGFNYYSASVLAAYIADISWFPSPSRLVSWVGLCPSVYQTRESLYRGRMKGGSRKVKWIMTQAANTAIRSV
ncbi:MAG: transposase [Candidatus Bathyarchaeia archaeon]